MPKAFGRANIKVNGQILKTNKGATFDPGGVMRTSKTTSGGQVNFTEEVKPSRLECAIPYTAGGSIAELAAIEDATINVETDVGASHVMPHAFLVEPPKTGDQDGDISLIFEGAPAEQL